MYQCTRYSFLKYCKQKIRVPIFPKVSKITTVSRLKSENPDILIKQKKNCRVGQNTAFCKSCIIWHAKYVSCKRAISTCFNIIWSHGCASTSIFCIKPYFDLLYIFLLLRMSEFSILKGFTVVNLVIFGKIGL